MPRPALAPVRSALATALTCVIATTTVAALVTAGSARTTSLGDTDRPASYELTAAKKAGTIVTPGDFTGFGFDQCLAPSQKAMDTWLLQSPFLAVGIYTSGKSRACRSQPNLTPTWIATQLRKGWRLLPITLGPQASCQPRFPRYDDDVRIDPRPGKNGTYGIARKMGKTEADTSVRDAKALGIIPGSTLWYDLEGYDSANVNCRESALQFLSGWTIRLHELGYVSGVYSSAGSGIKDLDNARVNRPGVVTMPDRIWVARWDGVANTSTSYLREDGWRPGGRVKQYQGGHDETWGGVTINIDRNFLDLGRGSIAAREVRCGGVNLSFKTYEPIRPASATQTPAPGKVKALQCLLKEKGVYTGTVSGKYRARTIAAARAWQQRHGFAVSDQWNRKNWMSLLSHGPATLLKYGSAGEAVRRLQRALNATGSAKIAMDGTFGASTLTALKAYQTRTRRGVSGVVTTSTWQDLLSGTRQRR